MIITKEAIKRSGLSEHHFRRFAKELNICPLKVRGEMAFKWTEEQIELIKDFADISIEEKKEINELEIVEYYIYQDSNIHRISKRFNINYRKIFRIINKYERTKCVIVESKIKEYD